MISKCRYVCTLSINGPRANAAISFITFFSLVRLFHAQVCNRTAVNDKSLACNEWQTIIISQKKYRLRKSLPAYRYAPKVNERRSHSTINPWFYPWYSHARAQHGACGYLPHRGAQGPAYVKIDIQSPSEFLSRCFVSGIYNEIGYFSQLYDSKHIRTLTSSP